MTATANILHPVIIQDTLPPTLSDLPPSRAGIQSIEFGCSLLVTLATPLAAAARQLSSDPGFRGV